MASVETIAAPSREHRGVAAMVLVVLANFAFAFWMFAPPSVLAYQGWYVDIYGPTVVFATLLVALALGWATGFLPRRSPWVLAAVGIVIAELALVVLGTLWLLWMIGSVAADF